MCSAVADTEDAVKLAGQRIKVVCDTSGVKLGELIETRKRDLGESYDKLIDRSRTCGFTMTKASLSEYATDELTEAPKRRTLEAIACALDVSYAEVVLAMAESLIGSAPVEVSNLQHVNSYLTLLGGRTDEEVESVIRVVRTVTAALDAAHGDSGDRPEGVQRNGRTPTAPPNGGADHD